ncbi:MAG: hypothetical protein ACRDM0_23680, partial [Thermoleophilaceae bacterium]
EVERESQRLVVLDSLYNFIQGQGFALKDEQVAEVLRAIKADVCDPTGVTVLTIDHSPWPSENTRGQRRAYGSVFKAAAIRWAVHLERDGENLWSEAHGNNLRGFKRRLTVWDEETLELRLHEAEHGYQKAPPADIAEWIRGRESGTASPAEIREAFGIEHHALAKRRAELAELGIAYVPAGGKSRYQVASDPEVSGHYPAPADPSIARERGDSLFSCGFESNPRPPALEGARGAETAHLQGDSEPAPPRSLKGDPSAGAGVPPEAGDSA